ncbi:MAG: RluA family pseudouridine synthase [Clostridiales bacterium]|jgi:23S rRNA pseudouridine955/2504/2580 synthase|nr:RluA family pseudouridine synthase [Clostridiales bacterium]
MREARITQGDSGGRLDKYLLRLMPESGRGFIYKMLRKKNITLNGARAEGRETLREGDVIKLFLSDETIGKFEGRRRENRFPADISVVYEDEGLLVCDKPAGLLSQAARAGDDCLLERVRAYLPEARPALCNRLDRNTSGLVLCAKTLASARETCLLLASGQIRKFYAAQVIGAFTKEREVSEGYFKDRAANKAYVSQNGETAARARFSPLALSEDGRFSLVEIELLTGKSHQIRVQLANMGFPIIGDPKYGNPSANRAARAKYQRLRAYKLIFPNGRNIQTHMDSGEILWLKRP